MENIDKLISALASLFWPTSFIIIILKFGGTIRTIIESAKSRKFSIKVAGNELSMEEVSEQQRVLISDLQKQIVSIEERISTLRPKSSASDAKRAEAQRNEVRSILWVDDNPRNNSFLIEDLNTRDIQVVTSLSTSDALAKLSQRPYDRIISDMGRKEASGYNQMAGIDLIKEVRKTDKKVPILIYCSTRAARGFRDQALLAGATEITSSPSVLLKALNLKGY